MTNSKQLLSKLDCYLCGTNLSSVEGGKGCRILSNKKEHRSEATIQELEEIHNILLDKSPDPILAYNQDGRYLYVNQAFAKGVGKSIEQIIGKTIWDVFVKEEADKRFAALNQVFQSGEEYVVELHLPRLDGDLYFITTMTPVSDSDGKVIYVICSSKDITERKQMEMSLRENEEKFRVFFTTSRDSVFMTSQDGHFEDFNDVMLETFGYNSREELQAVLADDLYDSKDERAKYLSVINNLGSTKDYPVNMRKKDGTIINALLNTVLRKDSKGKIIGCQGTVRDITTQKLAEEALQASEAKYRLLVDHSYDLLWHITVEGVFTYVSPSWERITGYIPSSKIGTSYKDIVHPDDISVCEEYLHYIMSSNKVVNNVQYRVRHADGTWHWHNASGMPVIGQKGEVVSVVGISRDITEQKKAAEKLIESEEKYRLLVSQMKQGLAFHEVICNESGRVIDYRFLYANEQFEKMTGFQREKILGKTVREIWPETKNYWIEKYGQVGITGEILEFEQYFKRKSVFYNVLVYSPQPGQFASVVTDMTDRKKMEKIIFEEKELLKITLLSVGDGVITTDKLGKVNLLNKVAEQLTGWTMEEAYCQSFEEVFPVINEFTREICKNIQTEVLDCGRTVELANHAVLICKNGLEMPIENTAAPIRDEEGKINGMVLVFRDFTEKKKKQEKIKHLSFHDSLTGLYNRRFFEEELIRLDVKRNLPITLVMADVNGLKLANDAFGHLAGDRLLQKAAEVIKNECRVDDILARIGGDEFVLLLPRTNSDQAATIVKRINDALVRQRVVSNDMLSSFVLSISFGWDSKLEETEDIAVVFKKAEDFMYRRKLSESTSMRHETIKLIIQTLYEKSEREQFHSVQVSEICEVIGAALELSVEQINELRTAGLMHDIGKIVLNDQILDKQGSLSDSEWFEIKRHAETGYRILESVKEFSQLAEYVLAHHERWDGKGYPKGLMTEEIPLEARIIAIADSYNAMISDRPYRKAMSKEAAIEEIIKNSGTQFDPVIATVFVEKVLKVKNSL
jgi:diguanylate cyclase (GGDEF)-like protein/PAS domain S-box-containing protein